MLDKVDVSQISMTASAVSAAGATAAAQIDVQMFGIPLAVLLAGFAGATLALSLLPKMSLTKAFAAVALGTFAASYGTPIFALLTVKMYPEFASIPHPPFAFFAGLFAQLALSWAFKRLPTLLDKKTGLDTEAK